MNWIEAKLASGPGPFGADTGVRFKSDTRVDTLLLACTLFLQRFDLAFGGSLLELVTIPTVLIIVHQFLSGRLLIDYDRLLWFLPLGLAATCSLLLNFQQTMLPSYCLFLVVYSLFLLRRSSTADRYRETLRSFQFMATLISVIAVVQFFAQFVIDGRQLIRFYGIVPDFLLAGHWNTIIPINGSLLKSNGLFLVEPSALSQVTGLAILIEVVEFGRLRYLLLLALGWLLSYGGTGLLLVLGFLPLASMGQPRARLPALFLVIFAVGLIATGVIDIAAFTARAGEFENTKASGFSRFVSPFWMAGEQVATAPLPVLLLGSGPGTADAFANNMWYTGFATTWFKLFYEYGLAGTLSFALFFVSALRKSMCPGVVVAAILFMYVFLGGQLLSVSILIPIIVLCTLNKTDDRRGSITAKV